MADYGLTVRMYNVGFGDCFLISYQPDDRLRRMLVDCGSHLSGPGPRSISKVVERIVKDVTDDGRPPRIDVVVASHRHFDHISGFDNPAWASVEVGEVWLPWTEHPSDPAASRIRQAQTKLAAALAQWAAQRPRAAAAVHELALNALSNADAMQTLLRGFAGRPRRRFLPEADKPATFSTRGLPEMQVHVLGPSRDERVIRNLDPPRDQSYLRLLGTNGSADAPLQPFPTLGTHSAVFERDRTIARLHKALAINELDLAAALEDAVNGTSLVLALELGTAVLLLTGDAQWGTWKAALDIPEMQELVGRATFLKVGHHGSHNASPKKLIDGPLPNDLLAMVSVRPVSRWQYIPKKELLARLAEKGVRLARSDKFGEAPPEFRREGNWSIDVDIPT